MTQRTSNQNRAGSSSHNTVATRRSWWERRATNDDLVETAKAIAATEGATISPDDIDRLSREDIATVVWARIGQDIDHGLENASTELGIDYERLMRTMVNEVRRDTTFVDRGLKKYWLELVIASFVFSLLLRLVMWWW